MSGDVGARPERQEAKDADSEQRSDDLRKGKPEKSEAQFKTPKQSWVPPRTPLGRREPPIDGMGDADSLNGRGKRGPKYGLWVLVFVVLLVLAFGISSLFAGATVKVTPRTASTSVTGTFTASSDSESGTVPFDIIKVTHDDSRPVSATEAQGAAAKATGQIVIYNNQSSAAQTLVANTRFESPDGLIYRISKGVTVPGNSIKNGEKVPGSVTVTVTADKAGSNYNIGLVDFTIPGFQGDPRHTTIYGRSKTPMTGGTSGDELAPSADAAAQAKDEIETALKPELLKDVESQIPQNFTTFDSGLIYSFEDLPATAAATGTVDVGERGTLYAIIINKAALGQAVADRFLAQFSGGDVEISNLPDLGLTFASSTAAFDPETDTKFDFTLNGNAKLVWQYDPNVLKRDLAGISKSQVDTVMAKYPSIESASVIIRPFWSRSLPKDTAKISIVDAVTGAQVATATATSTAE